MLKEGGEDVLDELENNEEERYNPRRCYFRREPPTGDAELAKQLAQAGRAASSQQSEDDEEDGDVELSEGYDAIMRV